MNKRHTYKGYDLDKITQNDIATKDQPELLIDYNAQATEEDRRLDSLYIYAEHYQINDLLEVLKQYESTK